MKYFEEVKGVSLLRYVYAVHFDEPGDFKTDYWITINDCEVDEDENPKALAKRLRGYADRLIKIAKFLEKIGDHST